MSEIVNSKSLQESERMHETLKVEIPDFIADENEELKIIKKTVLSHAYHVY